MVEKIASSSLDQSVARFYIDLEAFVKEALDQGFEGVAAVEKFRLDNQLRRLKLRQRAHDLGLIFEKEASEVQERVVAEKKERLENKN